MKPQHNAREAAKCNRPSEKYGVEGSFDYREGYDKGYEAGKASAWNVIERDGLPNNGRILWLTIQAIDDDEDVEVIRGFYYVKGVMPTMHLLHSCDTPLCVNPNHLREGTDADNAKDRIKHGVHHRGSQKPLAKLIESQVVDIRLRASRGERQAVLSREYGVNASIICEIISRKRWRHVE